MIELKKSFLETIVTILLTLHLVRKKYLHFEFLCQQPEKEYKSDDDH